MPAITILRFGKNGEYEPVFPNGRVGRVLLMKENLLSLEHHTCSRLPQ